MKLATTLTYVPKKNHIMIPMSDRTPLRYDPLNYVSYKTRFTDSSINTRFVKVSAGMRQQREDGFSLREKVRLRLSLDLAINALKREKLAHDRTLRRFNEKTLSYKQTVNFESTQAEDNDAIVDAIAQDIDNYLDRIKLWFGSCEAEDMRTVNVKVSEMLEALTNSTATLTFIDARKQNRFAETVIDSGNLMNMKAQPFSMATVLALRGHMGIDGVFVHVTQEMLSDAISIDETARIILNDVSYTILNTVNYGINSRLFYDAERCQKIARSSSPEAFKSAGCWSYYIVSYACSASEEYKPTISRAEFARSKSPKSPTVHYDIFTETEF